MVESFWTSVRAEKDNSSVDSKIFDHMIGSLQHLALRKRPHILLIVRILARFQKNPTYIVTSL